MVNAHKLKELFGTPQLPGQSIWLSAGTLRAELKGPNLGSIYFDGVEVLRGISFLVRDENWGTCPAKVTGLKFSCRKNAFTVSYKAEASGGTAKLTYHATVSATPNQLVFHAKAIPEKDFKTNRTGFVVLHPINGVAGRPLTVTHTDGTNQRARFPKLISPGQPFFEICGLEHTPAPGLKAKVQMEGHKFEMEDQRNWSDASYKTYVCSLLEPWPYVLQGGQAFEQKITLTITGRTKMPPRITSDSLQIGRSFKLPEIGVAIQQDQAEPSLKSAKRILQLAPKHLTCALDGAEEMGAACAAYATLSASTGIPVTLEIVLPGKSTAESEMSTVAKAVLQSGLEPKRIVVTQAHDLKSFQPTDKRPWGPSYEEMASAARKYFPAAEIGGGMMSYFTELNRKRPPLGLFDFITHSICPIVHDASDAAVMQTLESLPHIFATAKSFIGKSPYHLGPSSSGARINPYGSAPAHNPKRQRVCLAANDPRQNGSFAQTWNLGVLSGQASLQSVTLSSIHGPQGLIDGNGVTNPLFNFLSQITPFSGKRVAAIRSQDSTIIGFAAKTEKGVMAWLANRGEKVITFSLNGKRIRLLGYQMRVVKLN